jgi:hypothetical protein
MGEYYLLDYDPGTAQYTFPRRGGAKLSGTAIIHTAECARDDVGEDLSAELCAKFIAERADWGSYHRLVDSDSLIRMLPWEYEAWQDTETNNWAVGISAALRTSDWRNMPADREDRVYWNMAASAAEFVTYMKTNYGITVPLVRISGAQARARVPGFCAHGDSGISRSDPGVNFDWEKFFRYTKGILEGITQEDELSAAEAQHIISSLEGVMNHVFDRLKGELPTDTANAVFGKQVGYADPETAQVGDAKTTLETLVTYNDFQHTASRRTVADAARAIVDAVKAAPAEDAAGAAEAAYAAFLEKLGTVKVGISVEEGA